MKFKFKSGISVCLLLCTLSSIAQINGVEKDKEKANLALILSQPKNNKRIMNREIELVSSVASSKDGKVIYLAWYSGGPDEGPGNYVTLSVSTDGGNNWLNDQLVVFPKVSEARFFDPVLWRDKNDQVWLFSAVSKKTSSKSKKWDLRGGVYALPVTWDGKKVSHGEGKILSYGIMMNKPFYSAPQDKVFFPSSIWRSDKDHPDKAAYIQDGTFIYSHDYKKSPKLGYLQEYSSIKAVEDSIRTFDEHQIVDVNGKGEFLALVRTKDKNNAVYFSKSKDYGKSWTNLQPFTLVGPTASSRFHITRLQSGNLLLILNNSKKRTNMTAFISKDEGKTWPHKLLLDNRDKVSYPDADQDKNGVIHITYDRDRKGAKEINYCKITEKDILEGDEKAIFKMRVNK